jgi:type 2 lantibiotic biosynthesis protein LanM
MKVSMAANLIDAWTEALSPERDTRRLTQRLRFLGWSDAEARSRLSRDSLFGPIKEPAALSLLECGLALFEHSNPQSKESKKTGLSSGETLPFEEVLAPFAFAAASDLIRRERHRWLKPMSRPARRALVRSLRMRLCETAAPALAAALRRRSVLLSLALPGLRLPPQKGPYLRFVDELRQGGLRTMLADLPVLAHMLCARMEQWQAATAEFLLRLRDDGPALQASFGLEKIWIAHLKCDLGDCHQEGRNVMAVTFADGKRLVYKPRCLHMGEAWFELLEWLKQKDANFSLSAPRVLSRENYGWVEWVDPATIEDEPRAERYYQCAGELLALAWLFSATDLHEENVIATQDGPVIIDLETLFTPVVRPFFTSRQELDLTAGKNDVGVGILNSLLLPVWQVDENGRTRDLSGFAGRMREEASYAELIWVDLGTDQIRLEPRIVRGSQPHNIPRDGKGRLLLAHDHTKAIVEGFIRTARFMLEHRAQLLDPAGILVPFREGQIRYLIRDSQVYGLMLRRLLRAEFLGSFAVRDIEIEKLARAYFPLTTEEPRPDAWNCYDGERHALTNGDIPLFYAKTDELTLHGDGGIQVHDYFWRTGWNVVQTRLSNLDEAAITEQAGVIRASLNLSSILPAANRDETSVGLTSQQTIVNPLRESDSEKSQYSHTPALQYSASPESSTRHQPNHVSDAAGPCLLNAAERIAADIERRSITLRQGGVTWLSLSFDPLYKRQVSAVLGLDLYGGTLGVAIFLAALANTTGERRWAALAEKCTRNQLDQLRAPEMRVVIERMPLGIGTGLGSLIEGCRVLGGLLGNERYFSDAQYFSEFASAAAAAKDTVWDVLGGTAGSLLALLNLHRIISAPQLLESASTLGMALLEKRVRASTGHAVWLSSFAEQPLTGFGHGAAGIALALDRLGRETGETAFCAAAEEAIDYERAVFDPEQGNWPDFRRGAFQPGQRAFMYGWCAGPAGIGLARLAQPGGRTPEVREEIQAAIVDAMSGPSFPAGHLCCGRCGRIELLLEAANRLADNTLREAAVQKAMMVESQAQESGFYALNGADRGRLFAPSFFQGISGIGYTFLRILNPRLPSVLSLV